MSSREPKLVVISSFDVDKCGSNFERHFCNNLTSDLIYELNERTYRRIAVVSFYPPR